MGRGILDDAAVLFISGGPFSDGIEGATNLTPMTPVYLYSAYDGVKTMGEDGEKIHGGGEKGKE